MPPISFYGKFRKLYSRKALPAKKQNGIKTGFFSAFISLALDIGAMQPDMELHNYLTR
jgi:hypothetical protein